MLLLIIACSISKEICLPCQFNSIMHGYVVARHQITLHKHTQYEILYGLIYISYDSINLFLMDFVNNEQKKNGSVVVNFLA